MHGGASETKRGQALSRSRQGAGREPARMPRQGAGLPRPVCGKALGKMFR